MQIDQPVITSAAFFTALLVFDIQQRMASSLPGHLVLGVITTLGLLGLCQLGSVNTAWMLVIFPFIVIILAYMIKIVKGVPHKLGPGGTPPLGPYGPGGTPPIAATATASTTTTATTTGATGPTILTGRAPATR